jgi:hypothetical protein
MDERLLQPWTDGVGGAERLDEGDEIFGFHGIKDE